MEKGSEYYECLGKPKSEDFSCSDSLTYDIKNYKEYVRDHQHYFNVNVSPSIHRKFSKENLLFV